MISIQELKHQFNRSRFQIDIPSLKFDQDGITALIGSNGNGKSTLLSIIAGIIKPKRGIVRYNNHNAFHEYEKIKSAVHLLSWDFGFFPWAKGSALLELVKQTSIANKSTWDDGLAVKLQE